MDASVLITLGLIALVAIGLTCSISPEIGQAARLVSLWNGLEAAFGSFLMVGMVMAAAAQVAVRYALSDYLTLSWTEELSRLLLVWGVFWGAAMLHRTDDHISVTIILDLLPHRAQHAIRLLGDLVVLALLIVIVWQGTLVAESALGIDTITLGLPAAAFAAAIPIGGIVMAIYTILHLIRRALRQSALTEIEEA